MNALHPFLPHRAPMLLIDAVENVTPQGGTGHVRLDTQAWYADSEGRTPAWIGLEFMAQAIAACRGQQLALAGGPPVSGYLVGTRAYRSTLPAFPPGAALQIKVALRDEDPSGLCSFHCEILHLGLPVAEATLKVIHA